MSDLLLAAVIAIPTIMCLLILVGALMRISDKPTPPVTGPIGDEDPGDDRG